MKAIMLDIDGVICLNHLEFDAVCLSNLKYICEKTGAVCVLSSDWRIVASDKMRIEKALSDLGICLYGATDYTTVKPRWTEIKEWLAIHPEVKKYAIIDDASKAEIKGENTFFRTQYCTKGLNAELADKIVEYLNADT
jgi:hypothetical protein